MVIAAVYLFCVLFIGWLGRNKAIGFFGFAILAVTLSPPAAFVILMITNKR